MTPRGSEPTEGGAGAGSEVQAAHQEWARQVRQALEVLARRLQDLRPLHRQDVRPLLLPLGALLAGDAHELAAECLERVRALTTPSAARFREAVESELQLAAAEYVQGVDLRYLSLPGYDFEYTLGSREGLEARQLAAAEFGVLLPAATVAQVESADARLEFELERRGRNS
jgi:hypothetical protein